MSGEPRRLLLYVGEPAEPRGPPCARSSVDDSGAPATCPAPAREIGPFVDEDKSYACGNYQYSETVVKQAVREQGAGGPVAVLPRPAPPLVPHSAPPCVTVPLGWRRVVSSTSVLYLSPSGTALGTLPQLREYLQTAGTCKCGLPCPLRPETAFSFDPKVTSKPYQASTGPELAKLCNHKRKLLATLQARGGGASGTPPPQLEQKKGPGTEVALLKKKVKRRAGIPANMITLQKEKANVEYKGYPQDGDQCRTGSPGVLPMRINSQSCPPAFNNVQQHLPPNMVAVSESANNSIKADYPVHRTGSHYLTVNSGWINSEPMSAHKPYDPTLNTNHQPLVGNNGQMTGLNTSIGKMESDKSSHSMDRDQNKLISEMSNQQHNITREKQKEEESHIFCGLNQPLTPEVMQKINEQQQIFIQQNQKQIEMARKGFRSQMTENANNNFVKSQCQNNYVPQGQLVIQNGTVMKSNPGKTPPWQVKRNDAPVMHIPGNSPKLHKLDDMEYDDVNINTSDSNTGSSSSGCNSYSDAPNEVAPQPMCTRVPPLPQHYSLNYQQQWAPTEGTKRKVKNTKVSKKKQQEMKNAAHGNNGMRVMEEAKSKPPNEQVTNNQVPSFMDDPNGYLAQQTVLLNNTISRQVGIHTSYEHSQYDNSNISYTHAHSEKDKSYKTQAVKMSDYQSYRNNLVPNTSPSPNSTPDSSALSDKSMDHNPAQCCKGCTPNKTNCDQYVDNSMRRNFVRQNVYSNKHETDGNHPLASPKNVLDENPVVSSTYIDRNMYLQDSCGPIQAGTVSTSHVSPMEHMHLPQASPTPSNSSRNTDTPQSNNGGGMHLSANCNFAMSSPVYSNSGSCRDNCNSNPSTPGSGQSYAYSSPGPPTSHMVTGTQMMHFISNHNVNKNLMEVNNISLVGVKPGGRTCNDENMFVYENKRTLNAMPGYCPPPHMGGGPPHSLVHASYVQSFVTTMASGFSVTRDTVTSVLAGRAQTATTSINASTANYVRLPPPPSVNMATSYAIPNNQPDPFINSVNLPTSYPLHIAGTTAQNMISKSPLEMVQNVIGNLSANKSDSIMQQQPVNSHVVRKNAMSMSQNQILFSSSRQIMVSNGTPMPPPPPKTSSNLSPTTASGSQVVPGGQSAVVVNTLQAPFVIQPPMVAVDNQVVQQNTVMPQMVTGGLVTPGQSPNESPRQIDLKTGQGFVQGVAMLSPESLKKKNKKKSKAQSVTSVLQITAPQPNSSNIMVHHTSPQQNTSPQFSPRGFQLSPNNNMTSTPVLQALTIVPGKSGTPAHIVMGGQNNPNNFGSQQILTNTSPSQQINLLQPVNLLNNTAGVMPNFQPFQQFIVPNIGSMMMTTDGTIIQDGSTGVQLQLQTVNGQNVLTPVQNSGMFATGTNTGVVIRAQNQSGKIIQSQHSPGAQFLSPNSQVMMSSPTFNSQLSPLLANLSPTGVTYQNSHQVRSNVQQDFIQTNQMGQTLMVPLSPKSVTITSANNRNNSTFVQQNTTIVQQQTTLVSNSHPRLPAIAPNLKGTSSRISIDSNILLGNTKQMKNKNYIERPIDHQSSNAPTDHIKAMERTASFPQLIQNIELADAKNQEDVRVLMGQLPEGLDMNGHVRHSVSTQTLLNQRAAGGGKSPNNGQVCGSSPPDTTTHSPLGALECGPACSPRMYAARSLSTQGNYADTTTKSPEPIDNGSLAMVQCVSSSEQDMLEQNEQSAWASVPADFATDTDTQNLMSNLPLMRQGRAHPHAVLDANEIHYNQTISVTSVNNQQSITITPTNYYERAPAYKRKNEFNDLPPYRTDKMMRSGYPMVQNNPEDIDYDQSNNVVNKSPNFTQRHYPPAGSASDGANAQKLYDRHLGAGNDSAEECDGFNAGDVVWGPVRGFASWPGKLVARLGDDRWTVRWFGSGTTGSVAADRLLSLTEGLEAHHAARTKHRKSRKLNINLENAIQEAMAELDKKSESGSVTSEQNPTDEPGTSPEETSLTETPRKHKKKEGARSKHKKSKQAKTSSALKGDNSRLRSSR